MKRPRWRKFTWFILLFNVLAIAYIVVGLIVAQQECEQQTLSSLCDYAVAEALQYIVTLWVAANLILGVVWFVTNKPRSRPCPVCGVDVRKGETVCASCGHDFRAAMAGVRDGEAAVDEATPPSDRWDCPSCGRSLSFAARFCVRCGVEQPRECPACSHPVFADFCTRCGASVAARPALAD